MLPEIFSIRAASCNICLLSQLEKMLPIASATTRMICLGNFLLVSRLNWQLPNDDDGKYLGMTQFSAVEAGSEHFCSSTLASNPIFLSFSFVAQFKNFSLALLISFNVAVAAHLLLLQFPSSIALAVFPWLMLSIGTKREEWIRERQGKKIDLNFFHFSRSRQIMCSTRFFALQARASKIKQIKK
jgi:hypothetical protein